LSTADFLQLFAVLVGMFGLLAFPFGFWLEANHRRLVKAIRELEKSNSASDELKQSADENYQTIIQLVQIRAAETKYHRSLISKSMSKLTAEQKASLKKTWQENDSEYDAHLHDLLIFSLNVEERQSSARALADTFGDSHSLRKLELANKRFGDLTDCIDRLRDRMQTKRKITYDSVNR
jgi:hypothetical protein